jgi:S1-C subfamily serine protease
VRRRLADLVAGVLLLSGCVGSPPDLPPPASLPSSRPVLEAESNRQRAAEITVRVRNRGCGFLATGSGFATAPTTLVTNRHVVEGAEELQLDSWDGRSVRVALLRVAYVYDLALVETVESLPRVARLAVADPAPGAGISVVGFPLGGPLRHRRGTVVDKVGGKRFEEYGPVLRIRAAVKHGNSGGPLLDDAGQVVGVVFAVEKATGYGLAIPVSTLRSVMRTQEGLGSPPPACG